MLRVIKAKSLWAILALAAVGTGLLQSCSDEIPITRAEEYEREFIKNFGSIDPQQTWNMASRNSVTVTVDGTQSVQIYKPTGTGTYYKIADYAGVSGTRTLEFDAVDDSTNDLLVVVAGHSKSVKPGNSVSFGASRAFLGEDDAEVTYATEYVQWDIDVMKRYLQKVPEEQDNILKVTNNFSYVMPEGGVKFYPIYWNTSSTHKLGVYWKDSNGKLHTKYLYADKDGDDILQYGTKHNFTRDEFPWEIGHTCCEGHTITSVEKSEDGKYTTQFQGAQTTKEACYQKVEPKVGDICANCKCKITEIFTDNNNSKYHIVDESYVAGTGNNVYGTSCYGMYAEATVGSTCSTGKVVSEVGEYCHYHIVTGEVGTYTCTDLPSKTSWESVIIDNFFNSYQVFAFDENDQPWCLDWHNSKAHSEEQAAYGSPWNRETDESSLNSQFKDGDDAISTIQAKGITLELEPGTVFGFFLEVYLPGKEDANLYDSSVFQHVIFSEEAMNQQYSDPANNDSPIEGSNPEWINGLSNSGWKGTNAQGEYCFAATFNMTDKDGNTRTYFSFEDWNQQGPDLNDLVFMFEKTMIPEKIIDHDKIPTWVIACEDLGNLNDYDFNDVVFAVEHVSGETTATVYPLAAGGTLDIELHRTNEDGTDIHIGGKEFHQLVKPGADFSEPINVGGGEITHGSPITINVPENFTMTTPVYHNAAATEACEAMGGFYIKVKRGQYGEDTNTVTPPMNGEAPQMILVHDSWRWPQENQHIVKAYEKFGEWGKNYHDHEWHFTPTNAGLVVKPWVLNK